MLLCPPLLPVARYIVFLQYTLHQKPNCGVIAITQLDYFVFIFDIPYYLFTFSHDSIWLFIRKEK